MKERTAESGCCQCRYMCTVRYGVKEMNYRVIWPAAWVIMNLWLMLIVILADNQIPRRLSIGVWVLSGVSVMVALWMLHKELQRMLK